MSNYTVSQPARLSVLLEESEIASYLSYTAFAVAMISVLQALHFARDAVVTKCGAQRKPTPDLHHEGQQNGEQGKTGCLCGCCKKLGRKLTWLYHKYPQVGKLLHECVRLGSSIHSAEAFDFNWSKRWCGVPQMACHVQLRNFVFSYWCAGGHCVLGHTVSLRDIFPQIIFRLLCRLCSVLLQLLCAAIDVSRCLRFVLHLRGRRLRILHQFQSCFQLQLVVQVFLGS